jgi:hypothetical protein
MKFERTLQQILVFVRLGRPTEGVWGGLMHDSAESLVIEIIRTVIVTSEIWGIYSGAEDSNLLGRYAV